MSARIPAGALLLSPEDCRILCQVADVNKLRVHHRIGDSRAYRILTDITVTAYAIAEPGREARQAPVSEERENWSVKELAAATGRARRTVRLDIETNSLPATKPTNAWLITNTDAEAYIASHRKA